MLTRRSLIFTTAAAVTLPIAGLALRPARAGTASVFNTDGIAINGFDPVAYFTERTHVSGNETVIQDWMGAVWRFSSEENRDLFAADPAAYAPQYGGYCAYAMANGYIAKTDPDAWTIHSGKLYLNYDLRVRELWSQDIEGFVARADKNWPGILNG
ncbi:YHS domain-containing (seleno)protein [Alisedimentitalea sp. MJ-SS2]|uniref:YHS domain-containing (seleno)protein n=1 Tax=Aliisedimentitalea sp. MJ-SS2 TaxID=3049795 RepID=UPI00290C6F16|nr:YHS domain-containing (seleno)protein [Alisedimentitalea sp. MJ-SS2]MDU8926287.1 YHS domain-containing (seleno)protein [Alisedimentitalea sp. MJ-SS2]